ncbi:MAG: ATP-grasp domain-containing protein [Pirellulales bacterium]|nr:ATP-grasp domain-containing protein [Pirellulales bacterium]
MMDRSANLLILGASARAAAQAAHRSGWQVEAIDLFADADLQAIARCTRVGRFSASTLAAAQKSSCWGWLYTGGLENYPRLVDRLARAHRLLGNHGAVLRAVRDPFRLAQEFAAAGLAVPEVQRAPSGLPRDGSWLLKLVRGSGGSHVVPWTAAAEASFDARRHYLQRRITGKPCSAAFVAAGGRACLVGMTEQLLAPSPGEGTPFRYGGSIGPLRPPETLRTSVERLGHLLAERFSLQGLFGVDGVVQGDTYWPIEINPRYVASLEVLEMAGSVRQLGSTSTIALHVDACADGKLPDAVPSTVELPWAGKRIVYAASALRVSSPVAQAWLESAQVADVPVAGSEIAAETPIATVLATGSSRQQVLERLDQAQAWLYAQFR